MTHQISTALHLLRRTRRPNGGGRRLFNKSRPAYASPISTFIINTLTEALSTSDMDGGYWHQRNTLLMPSPFIALSRSFWISITSLALFRREPEPPSFAAWTSSFLSCTTSLRVFKRKPEQNCIRGIMQCSSNSGTIHAIPSAFLLVV